MAFNPHKEELLLTASADHTVAMWDVRNLSKMLYSFQHHQVSCPLPHTSPLHVCACRTCVYDSIVCLCGYQMCERWSSDLDVG